jgi:hypothetical protein
MVYDRRGRTALRVEVLLMTMRSRRDEKSDGGRKRRREESWGDSVTAVGEQESQVE